MPSNRPPNESDILALAQALAAAKVEYAVIGGAAMALHGFPRMTKDIDLLLPVNPGNNARLLQALEALPATRDAVAASPNLHSLISQEYRYAHKGGELTPSD